MSINEFLRRILHAELVQQIGMTVEQTQKLVERLPLPGFTPLVPEKSANAGPKISPLLSDSIPTQNGKESPVPAGSRVAFFAGHKESHQRKCLFGAALGISVASFLGW